jgi:hypothetical protein
MRPRPRISEPFGFFLFTLRLSSLLFELASLGVFIYASVGVVDNYVNEIAYIGVGWCIFFDAIEVVGLSNTNHASRRIQNEAAIVVDLIGLVLLGFSWLWHFFWVRKEAVVLHSVEQTLLPIPRKALSFNVLFLTLGMMSALL